MPSHNIAYVPPKGIIRFPIFDCSVCGLLQCLLKLCLRVHSMLKCLSLRPLIWVDPSFTVERPHALLLERAAIGGLLKPVVLGEVVPASSVNS